MNVLTVGIRKEFIRLHVKFFAIEVCAQQIDSKKIIQNYFSIEYFSSIINDPFYCLDSFIYFSFIANRKKVLIDRYNLAANVDHEMMR